MTNLTTKTPAVIVAEQRILWAKTALMEAETKWHEPLTDAQRTRVEGFIEAWKQQVEFAEGELDATE